MVHRALVLPAPGQETFFLWGPRQVGKTTLLRETYPDAVWVDLLRADEFRRYVAHPERLREELLATADRPVRQVVIDEIQKVPALLDEVHWLHEHTPWRFALCGSSARKLRRGGVNLLGGRALRYELTGFTSTELGAGFDLDRMLNHGWLPRAYLSDRPGRLLDAYVGDYLQQEIAAEGLVRNVPVFARFLEAAALSDGSLVNATNIARECGVSIPTVKSHFEILVDTLIGTWLPAYTARPKRRVIQGPKFYFADTGIVNRLARRGTLRPGGELYGRALESWVHHEVRSHLLGRDDAPRLTYWRLAGGTEVDFLLDDLSLALEVKASATVADHHLRGLRQLAIDQPDVDRRVIVCLERRRRVTHDGILIVPAQELRELLNPDR